MAEEEDEDEDEEHAFFGSQRWRTLALRDVFVGGASWRMQLAPSACLEGRTSWAQWGSGEEKKPASGTASGGGLRPTPFRPTSKTAREASKMAQHVSKTASERPKGGFNTWPASAGRVPKTASRPPKRPPISPHMPPRGARGGFKILPTSAERVPKTA